MNQGFPSNPLPHTLAALPPGVQRGLEEMSAELSTMNPAFTIRRQFLQAQEECDMIDNLRRVSGGHASFKIEYLLKIEVQTAHGFKIIKGG